MMSELTADTSLNSLNSLNLGFKDPVFASKLNRDERFCRVRLVVGIGEGQREVRASPHVLVQAPFFDALFTENNQEEPIFLPELNPRAVKIIIEFLHTGILTLEEEEESLKNTLLAAHKFQLEDAKRKCLEVLSHNLTPTNCLILRDFANDHGFKNLEDEVTNFITHNLAGIFETESLLQLSFTQVKGIIEGCSKEVTSNEVILKTILKWVNTSEEERECHLGELLPLVDLGDLFDNARDFLLVSFASGSLLRRNRECETMYFDMCLAKAIQNSGPKEEPTSRENEDEREETQSPTRSPEGKRHRLDRPDPMVNLEDMSVEEDDDVQILQIMDECQINRPRRSALVSGAREGSLRVRVKSPAQVSSFHGSSRSPRSPPMNKRTKNLKPMGRGRRGRQSAKGGRDPPCSNSERRTPTPPPSPATSASSLSLAQEPAPTVTMKSPMETLQNKLLVYHSCEKGRRYLRGYSFRKEETLPLHDDRAPRKLSSLVAHEDKVWDIGGSVHLREKYRNGYDPSRSSNLVQVYRKGTTAGSPGPPLNDVRKEFGACVFGDYIYVTGGCIGEDTTNGVERLSLSARGSKATWEDMPIPMWFMRATHGVAVLHNKLFVVGGVGLKTGSGYGQATDLDSAEYLDGGKEEWSIVRPRMNQKRGYLMVGTANDKVYAIGGSVLNKKKASWRELLNTVEVFDPVRPNSWTAISPMNEARSRHRGVVVVEDGLVCVIGGNVPHSEPSMECYDHRMDQWIMCPWPHGLNKEPDFCSAIVIDY